MEDLKNTIVRHSYLQALADDKKFDTYKLKSSQSPNIPLFTPYYVNKEDEIKYDNINENILESSFDILNLNFNITDAAYEIESLMENVNNKIDSINEKLKAEEERVRDVNMICGNINDFNTIIPLSANNFKIKSSLYQYKNCLTASVASEEKVDVRLININGNGYVGNDYVVSKESDQLFEKDKLNTANEKYMYDNIKNTYWEYSRIFSYDSTNKSDIINIDDVSCTVQLTFEAQNELGINELVFTDDVKLSVTKIEISNDSLNWVSTFEGNISPNNIDQSYSNFSYIYGSGALIFPTTKYVKITLESNYVENNKIKINDIVFNNTYRKIIRINEVEARRVMFNSGSGTTENIITSGRAISAGIFVNEYIPDFVKNNLTDDIKYVLIINGKNYEVIPINSDKKGIKLIKYSQTPVKENYVTYINEPINSLQVALVIPTALKYSPYLANLKLCLGKQVSNV